MEKMIGNLIAKGVFALSVLLSIHSLGGPGKKEIRKLNKSLIFDLFINYELTEKNGNLSALIDYCPNLNAALKEVKIVSNMGGENETALFDYNEKNQLVKVSYSIDDRVYYYDFSYKGDQLSSVNIAGKKKITFQYDKKGKLVSISREKRGALFEYNFEYADGKKKANIKLFVVQGENRRPSPRKYYVSWNENYRIDGYYLDVYSGRGLTYSDHGDLTSFSFANVSEDNNQASWEYSYDDKGNWTGRKYKKSTFKRTIAYR